VKYYKLVHVGDVNVDVHMLQVRLSRHALDDISKLPRAGFNYHYVATKLHFLRYCLFCRSCIAFRSFVP
jgi:hypothetical protein